MTDAANGGPILTVEDLSVSFRNQQKQNESITDVVRAVNFDLHAGETVALVGESGSGKSLTALSILQLLPYPVAFHPTGRICYRETNLVGASAETLQAIRGNDIAMIFQEPMTALNPLHKLHKQIAESLALHQNLGGHIARSTIIDLLDQVGLENSESRLDSYPHQLSGGQRQRVMIAMALANQPEILLADEPTTALDVTVQAKILALLKEVQRNHHLGILLITHDLNMVYKIADRVLVMQNGRMVERGTTTQIFTSPQEPYTQRLLSAEPPTRESPQSVDAPVVEAEHIRVWFPLRRGILRRTYGHVKAVNDATLSLKPGHTLGIVGESGSGKTTLALALMRLIQSTGKMNFMGSDMRGVEGKALKAMRRQLQMVFQDPYGSLSPRMTVTDIISEGLDAHGLIIDPATRDQRVIAILKEVEIDPEVRFRYPHEFSGGQRQRIAIARALILEPKVLFLDEPTSALDRTVQVQVLALLNRIQREHNLSYVFISHDLSVVRSIADDLIVMKSGDVVEQGSAREIFDAPKHTYTIALLEAAFRRAA